MECWRNLMARCNLDHPEFFYLPRGKIGGSKGKVGGSKDVDCSAPAMRWDLKPLLNAQQYLQLLLVYLVLKAIILVMLTVLHSSCMRNQVHDSFVAMLTVLHSLT
jgi:hypothetical protein